MPRWTRAQLVTFAGMAAVAIIFGVLAYSRRWLADDGLIVVRIVDHILAGNGPVFNVLERVEGNTSALWPWLLALGGAITRIDSAFVTVGIGWLCAVGALVVAMDATRRWHRARGSTAMLVPFGILVPLGMYAYWDFATSGLESPLCLLWLATCWWFLVSLRDAPVAPRHQVVAAVVFGLGPLVRPDFAVPSAVFLVTAWLLVRPTRRRTIILILAAAALPVAYEIFRAGYYGMLVPNPALTKSATQSSWERGGAYLFDFIRPYRTWRIIPLFIALAIIYRRHLVGRDRILAAAPCVSGALLALYVTRVGGDFMHGRLLLPACFCVIAPAALVPLRTWSGIAAGLVAIWAVWAGVRLADGKGHTRIGDERLGYVYFTKHPNPVDPQIFVRAAYDPARLAKALREELLISESGVMVAKTPHVDGAIFVAGRLGSTGAAAPLDAHVVDTLGLVHPLGSRITMNWPTERPGHQKVLPWAWILAEFADPSVPGDGLYEARADQILAARRALDCGEIAELRAAVREPLTLSRFWKNLVGSVRRTRLVIPADPIEAERTLCR